MAVLYVGEYTSTLAEFLRGGGAAQAPTITEQTVSLSGSVNMSSQFGNNTHLIRVHTDTICSILIGFNVTATTGNSRMAANQTEYFGVLPGMIISAIENS